MRMFQKLIGVLMLMCVAFVSPAVEGFNDNVNRADPNFVKVSLLIMGPGDELFSCAGHTCLRLECPTFNLDYCFSYESERVSDKIWTFFKGDLKMGLFATPTPEALKEYEDSGRGVTQYTLHLPPDAKQRLWEHMDDLVLRGANLPYDYIRRGCAWSVLNCLRTALPPHQLEVPPWPEKFSQPRRVVFAQGIADFPWVNVFVQSIAGPTSDSIESNFEKLLIPRDLCDFLQTCRVNGDVLLDKEGVVLLPQTLVVNSVRFVTPLGVACLVLILVIGNLFLKWRVLDWGMLTVQFLGGVFFTYLIVFSTLPATDWNWLVVPFNPLPLIIWRWRTRWAFSFAGVLCIWELFMLFAPHRLADPAYLVIVLAYIVFYLKFSPRVQTILKRY